MHWPNNAVVRNVEERRFSAAFTTKMIPGFSPRGPIHPGRTVPDARNRTISRSHADRV
jgi:hypothetical protein